MANPITLTHLQQVANSQMFDNGSVVKLDKGDGYLSIITDPQNEPVRQKENKAVRQAVMDSLLTSEGKTNSELHFTAAKHKDAFSVFLTGSGENLTVGDIRALLNTLKAVQKLDEVNKSYYNAQSSGKGAKAPANTGKKAGKSTIKLPTLPKLPQGKPSAGKSTKIQSRQVNLPKLPTMPQVKTDAKSQSPVKTGGARRRTIKTVPKQANSKMSAIKNLLADKGFGKPNGTSLKGRAVTTAPSPSHYEEVLAEKAVTQRGKAKPKKKAFDL